MGIIHLQSFSTVQKQYSWIKFKPNVKGSIKKKEKLANKEGGKRKTLNNYFNEFHTPVYFDGKFSRF